MNDEQFNTLLASVKEAGQIQRGERQASRTFHLEPPYTPVIQTERPAVHYPIQNSYSEQVACQA